MLLYLQRFFEKEKAGFDTRYAETKVARKAVNFIDRVATNSEVLISIKILPKTIKLRFSENTFSLYFRSRFSYTMV